MFGLYTHTNDHCDNFDRIGEAVTEAIKGWHESEMATGFTVRNELEIIEATICPVGRDEALVVYATGETVRYRGIRYDNDKNMTCFRVNNEQSERCLSW